MVSIENLTFYYDKNEKVILKNVFLEIKTGSYVSILGENGSGKSTLVKLILGLYKPISGHIFCQAKHIGYVPQKKLGWNEVPITIFEFLNSYRCILKIKDSACIEKNLHLVGVKKPLDSLVGTLSGGELQRVLIARSLIGNPDLLILDEPSTGVDIGGQKALYELIRKLNTEEKKTVIAVEHNLQAAIYNSSDIFHLEKGCGHLCSPQQYVQEFINNKGIDVQFFIQKEKR